MSLVACGGATQSESQEMREPSRPRRAFPRRRGAADIINDERYRIEQKQEKENL